MSKSVATKKAEWKDISSFSHSDKERVPSRFEFRTKSVRVVLHRHIYGGKDDWFVTCVEVDMERQLLASKGTEEAKSEALAMVKARLQAMLTELS